MSSNLQCWLRLGKRVCRSVVTAGVITMLTEPVSILTVVHQLYLGLELFRSAILDKLTKA